MLYLTEISPSPGQTVCQGVGPTKKAAKDDAARKMLSQLDSANCGTSEDTGSVVGSESFPEDDIRSPDQEDGGNRGVQHEAGPVKSEEDVELEKLLDQFKEFTEFLRWKKRRQEKDLKGPDESPSAEKKAERTNMGLEIESLPVRTEIQEEEQKDKSAVKKRTERSQLNDLENKAEALPERRTPDPSFRLHQVRGREESSLASSSKESFHVFLEWSTLSPRSGQRFKRGRRHLCEVIETRL